MEETPVKPTKVKNAHWYKRILNKLCLDERLSPNRRLLAAMIGMQMDAQTDMDKKTMSALLLGEFVNKAGIKLFDTQDIKPIEPRTAIEQRAAKDIEDVFSAVLNVDFSREKAGESV